MVDPLQAGDPQTLGRYRLIGRLGRGGMGTVYLGLNESNEQVAIKVINTELAEDPSFHNRFLREVAAARKVRRFCTAPVLDASLRQRPLYVVTEYIDGPTLESAVTTSGPLQGSNLEGLAVGVATALNAIHDAGIVHRDLKPANVLLSGVGPRVIDFGIARAWEGRSDVTTSGAYIGTPAYLAPELLRGETASPASDVFSWGCVVAFAGTGMDPFGGNSLHEVLYRVANEPPMIYGLDGELQEIVERALSKHPHGRPSVIDLLDHLIGHTGSTHEAMPHVVADFRPSGISQINRAPLASPPLDTSGVSVTKSRAGRLRQSSAKIGILGAAIACLLVLMLLVIQLWPDGSDDPASSNAGNPSTPRATQSPSTQAKDSPTVDATSQPPQDGGDIDRRFLGKWTGLITHYGFTRSSFATTVVIDGGHLSEIVGRIEDTTLDCAGRLRLVTASRDRLVVEERIEEGKENCEDVVLVTLTYQNDGSLKFEYKMTNSHGDGMLRK